MKKAQFYDCQYAVDFCIPGAIQGGAWCFVNICWSSETIVDSELILNFDCSATCFRMSAAGLMADIWMALSVSVWLFLIYIPVCVWLTVSYCLLWMIFTELLMRRNQKVLDQIVHRHAKTSIVSYVFYQDKKSCTDLLGMLVWNPALNVDVIFAACMFAWTILAWHHNHYHPLLYLSTVGGK